MKLISWNVNGLRACLKKGFEDTFNQLDADVFCIQETKMQPGQADFAPEGYTEYINSAEKKGYSGTLIYTRVKPLNAWNGIGVEAHSHEGRAITLEFEDYYLVNVYVPNSQNELARIDYRMQWEDDLRAYLKDLDSKKPVILCGDLNVAHEDIDLKNPGPNRGAAGTVKLQNVQEIFGVSKKTVPFFCRACGYKTCRGRCFASSRMSDLAIYSITSFSARHRAHNAPPMKTFSTI